MTPNKRPAQGSPDGQAEAKRQRGGSTPSDQRRLTEMGFRRNTRTFEALLNDNAELYLNNQYDQVMAELDAQPPPGEGDNGAIAEKYDFEYYIYPDNNDNCESDSESDNDDDDESESDDDDDDNDNDSDSGDEDDDDDDNDSDSGDDDDDDSDNDSDSGDDDDDDSDTDDNDDDDDSDNDDDDDDKNQQADFSYLLDDNLELNEEEEVEKEEHQARENNVIQEIEPVAGPSGLQRVLPSIREDVMVIPPFSLDHYQNAEFPSPEPEENEGYECTVPGCTNIVMRDGSQLCEECRPGFNILRERSPPIVNDRVDDLPLHEDPLEDEPPNDELDRDNHELAVWISEEIQNIIRSGERRCIMCMEVGDLLCQRCALNMEGYFEE